jgi:hypothetical protein
MDESKQISCYMHLNTKVSQVKSDAKRKRQKVGEQCLNVTFKLANIFFEPVIVGLLHTSTGGNNLQRNMFFSFPAIHFKKCTVCV